MTYLKSTIFAKFYSDYLLLLFYFIGYWYVGSRRGCSPILPILTMYVTWECQDNVIHQIWLKFWFHLKAGGSTPIVSNFYTASYEALKHHHRASYRTFTSYQQSLRRFQ